MFKEILKIKFKIFKNQIQFVLKEESKLKCGFISLFVLSYLIGGIIIMIRAFNFILAVPFAGPILVERIFYLYFCILFIMLTISSLILTISYVFSSSETEYLLLLPIEIPKIFLIKFFEITMIANWAFIFLSIPIYISFGIVKQINIFYYLLSGFSIIIPFIIMCSALGYIITFLFIKFFWNYYGVFFISIIVAIINMKMFLLWKYRNPPTTNDISLIVNRLLEHTSFSINPYIPSSWLTKIFLTISGNINENLTLYFNLIFSLSFILISIIFLLNKNYGFDIWSKFRSIGSKKIKFSLFRCLNKILSYIYIINSNSRAMFSKDVQLFFRDPAQYSQFGIFFGILALYIINIKNMRYDITDPFWQNLIAFLNLGSVNLTLATLSTRFLYPLISLEGKSIWVIGLSPTKKSNVILTKFIYTSILQVVITLSLTILSNHMLNINGYTYYLTLGIALISGITLSAFAIGLGTIFPNFQASSAQEVVSGFGGTLTLILNILYVSVMVISPFIITHLNILGFINTKTTMMIIFLTFIILSSISIILTIFLLKLAIKKLENMEF